jgi:hypothetical protein
METVCLESYDVKHLQVINYQIVSSFSSWKLQRWAFLHKPELKPHFQAMSVQPVIMAQIN